VVIFDNAYASLERGDRGHFIAHFFSVNSFLFFFFCIMHFIHIFFRCGFAGTETLLKTNGKLGQRPRMKSFSRKYFFVFYSLVFMQPKNNSVKTLRKAVGKCARFEVMTRSFCQFPLPPLPFLPPPASLTSSERDRAWPFSRQRARFYYVIYFT